MWRGGGWQVGNSVEVDFCDGALQKRKEAAGVKPAQHVREADRNGPLPSAGWGAMLPRGNAAQKPFHGVELARRRS
jgi:hypothetical protein